MKDRYGLVALDNDNLQTHTRPIDDEILQHISDFGFESAFNEVRDGKFFLTDRQFDNLVFLIYPFASGGNFLANCLCLSDSIVTTLDDKCDFICSNYEKISKYWNDVQIYGFIRPKHTKYYYHVIHPIQNTAKRLWEFWPDSDKMIILKNASLFVSLRKCILSGDTSLLGRHNRKFLNRLDFNLFMYEDLSIELKSKLKERFNDRKQNYSSCRLKSKKQIYFWDVNWYLDEDEFIHNIEQLYVGLELSGLNRDNLIRVYRTWMNAMCRCLKHF